MKKSRKKNNFPSETHFMFMDDNNWTCWLCGKNSADCAHHIFGRGKQEGCEKSALNYAPLCNHRCHLPNHGMLTTDEGKKKMLTKTLKHLENIGYTLKDIDNEFLEKYKEDINRLNLDV